MRFSPEASSMAELHWFPLYVTDWLTSRSVTAMLPEQEGAYLRLLIQAWGDGSAEPRLEDDARKLAAWSRLGNRWKKLGPAVRAEFVERDGMLFNLRLSEVWQEQQKKHATASTKAKTAVDAREARKKGRHATIDSQRERDGQHLHDDREDHHGDDLQDHPRDDHKIKQSELDVVVEPDAYASGVLPSTAPRRALALNGAARSGASVADQVRAGERQRLEGEFFAWLRQQFDAWSLLHAEEFAAIKATVLRELGAPLHDCRKPVDQLSRWTLDNVIERVRRTAGWPDSDAWVASRITPAPRAEAVSQAGAA
jgi:uncharacterized protein YdaU (DUF1376 family)